MKKPAITEDRIIETALALILSEGGIQGLNLRRIARELKCAHTNLYNYFPDMDALLWRCVHDAGARMMSSVRNKMLSVTPQKAPAAFFGAFVDFYLANPGLFRLIWMEDIRGTRPEADTRAAEQAISRLVQDFIRACGVTMKGDKAMQMVHTIHCYLFGEVAIFLAGRGLIREEQAFRRYVVAQCAEQAAALLSRR